jgi:hypothetical protein
MSIEFKDKEVQNEYDDLVAEEESLANQLADIQERIRTILRVYEREYPGAECAHRGERRPCGRRP